MATKQAVDTRHGGGDGNGEAGGPENEKGRGREAESPKKIPVKGWKDVVLRTQTEVKNDHVTILAAGVAFYLMLSIFPFAIAGMSIYGLVADPSEATELVDSFRGAVPDSVAELAQDQLTRLADASNDGLTLGVIVALLVALASASKGARALIESTNMAFDEQETRGFIRLRLLGFLFTMAFLAFVAVSVGLILVVPFLLNRFGEAGQLTGQILRWPLLGVIAVIGLATLYRYAPDRDEPKWAWVSPGAVIATLLWLIGSGLFSLYANNFGSFNETYGSLSAGIVLLLWLFLTALCILFGAEINAEAERQTEEDSTKGPDQALGTRDAAAADTVAPAPRS